MNETPEKLWLPWEHRDYPPAVVIRFVNDSGVTVEGGRFTYPDDADKEFQANIDRLNGVLVDYESVPFPEPIVQTYEEPTYKQTDSSLLDADEEQDANLSPDLAQYFWIDVPLEQHEQFIEEALPLRAAVKAAYTEPLPAPPPAPIPNFFYKPQKKQRFLDAIQAAAAWARFASSNDCGSQVKIAIIDYAWKKEHFDLPLTKISTPNPAFVPSQTNLITRSHGSAAIGLLLAQHGGDSKSEQGMRGIVPGSAVQLYAPIPNPQGRLNIAAAIKAATSNLSAGDILLIEQQTRNPSTAEQFVPVEHYLKEFEAILKATQAGIVVIEPAGNSDDGLDNRLHDQFVRAHYPGRESGAIVVGAGTRAHSRSAGSNYSESGNWVHVQGWGEQVGSLGYGDLYSPDNDESKFYTFNRDFRLTSAASVIVAGVAAALQSIRKNNNQSVLSPETLRGLLADENNGSPQPGNTAEQIGPLPDLKKLIAAL